MVSNITPALLSSLLLFVSSEIIFKSWKSRKKFFHKPLFVIGSIKLLNLQKKKLGYSIKLKKIDNKFTLHNLKGNDLPVYNVDFEQKKPFLKKLILFFFTIFIYTFGSFFI